MEKRIIRDKYSNTSKPQKFTEPSMAIQSSKNECDVNNIMKRYKATGIITHLNTKPPVFGDATLYPGYQEGIIAIQNASEAFMSLNADVRKRFRNDPGELLRFLGDEKNRPEAEKLGLVQPKQQVKKEEPQVKKEEPPIPPKVEAK